MPRSKIARARKAEISMTLKLIIGIIIAGLMIFTVAKFISKFIGESNQGTESFQQLAMLANDVAQDAELPLGSIKSMVLIQDKGKGIYVVDAQSYDKVKEKITIAPFCEKTSCLCLCKNYKEEQCQQLLCEHIEAALSPGTSLILQRMGEVRRQKVTIIKCLAGEKYCKRSKEGDISIIFSYLDTQGAYDSIK